MYRIDPHLHNLLEKKKLVYTVFKPNFSEQQMLSRALANNEIEKIKERARRLLGYADDDTYIPSILKPGGNLIIAELDNSTWGSYPESEH